MTGAEIIRRLKSEGWELQHVRGSHQQFRHPERPGKVRVQHPEREIPLGTSRSIFRQAGWEWR
ncbi:MAG: type II toxin-antitoxin system HicA family toxin [Deltaproteobacteria bacterium]|nr:type II toxin-antitoxin system HicA family toxin [Deltaproteobacteria bacterium]